MTNDATEFQLKELATVQGGFPFRGSVEPVRDGPVLAVQMKDLSPANGVNWSGVTRTELPGRRSADWLLAGDILFVCKGKGLDEASPTALNSDRLGMPPKP